MMAEEEHVVVDKSGLIAWGDLADLMERYAAGDEITTSSLEHLGMTRGRAIELLMRGYVIRPDPASRHARIKEIVGINAYGVVRVIGP